MYAILFLQSHDSRTPDKYPLGRHVLVLVLDSYGQVDVTVPPTGITPLTLSLQPPA